ncbi:MAG TPA: LEA type 2 family protein [Gammaproteobacteria bacterium]|nr:LEA type 2 family protein [Gammaproteobacteria bacterium]
MHALRRPVPQHLRNAAAALLIAVLCSCSTLPNSDPLQVSVAGVEPLEGEGLELRLAVKVRVQNPNDAAVDYNGVALSLDLNGRKFGSGVSSEVGTVPRYGESVVTIPITIGVFNMARQVLGLVNGGDTKAVTYKVKGKLEGGVFGTRRFEDQGTIELPTDTAAN